MKSKIIGAIVGLGLLALAVVGAFASQQGTQIQPDATLTSTATTTPTAEHTANATATDTPQPATTVAAETDTPIPATATPEPSISPAAGDCNNDVGGEESTQPEGEAPPSSTASANDPCNVEQQGQHDDGDKSGDQTATSGAPASSADQAGNQQDDTDQQGEHQDGPDSASSGGQR